MTYQEIEDMAMKDMKDTSILLKGKKLFRLPKSTTKAELKRLIESGAEFYTEEKNEKKK